MTSISSVKAPSPAASVNQLLVIALEFHRSSQIERARDAYHRVLAEEPGNPIALHHLGLIAHQNGNSAEAETLVAQAIAAKPDYVEAYSNLSSILRTLRRPQEALAAGLKAISLNKDYAKAYSNTGNAYEDLGDYEKALAFYEKAAAIEPNFVEARSNAGNILRRLGRHEEALALYENLIVKRPDAPEPYFFLGNILRELSRPDDALQAYRHALALRPHFADVFCNLGSLLVHQTKLDEAAEAYAQAIALKPNLAEAHANLGMIMETQGKVGDAIACYRRALELNPDLVSARCELNYQRRLACNWTNHEAEEKELLQLILKSDKPVAPFRLLCMEAHPAEQLQVSRTWATTFSSYRRFRFDHAKRRQPKAPGRRLKIGYMSADFHRHATAYLMAELFERHDRTRFEVIAYSHGKDDKSDMRWRLREAFERFVDVKDMSAAETARLIFDDEIDILIDLKGYTLHARTEVAAMRPAPIQVSFIGYPGSMGVDFIDYVIADPFVLPFDQQPFYDEKIVHLPHSYQPNDTRRRIAEHTPTRTECGLPEEGFVFCCFNNSYKLTPQIFDIWMRLLHALPGAVLWLFDGNPLVQDNLSAEATKREIDPARLVFAPRMTSPEHLARHRLADLFLDTLPYNAHTTASDALWAGLPVLTCAGNTFAGRVAGSLLHAVGLPELVTASLDDYEAMALRLAREPKLLFAIRQKLAVQKFTAPLFDIARYTLDLERAFAHMWGTFVASGEPQAFAVEAADGAKKGSVSPQAQHFHRIAYAACPLCASHNTSAVFEADCTTHPIYRPALPPRIVWHECADCGHVFTDGYFNDDARAMLLESVPEAQSVGHDMEAQRLVSGRRVARVANHIGAPLALGDWLDVGFGNGSLLFTAEEWGFHPVGIDLRKQHVEMLRKLGYEAHCTSIDALTSSARFSVVSMADVLEHMPFPKEALRAAHRLLRPGGVLFLSMPNTDTMVWRLLHANKINPYWSEIEHHHQFSRKRLYTLLAEHGFQPQEYQISESARVGMEIVALREA